MGAVGRGSCRLTRADALRVAAHAVSGLGWWVAALPVSGWCPHCPHTAAARTPGGAARWWRTGATGCCAAAAARCWTGRTCCSRRCRAGAGGQGGGGRGGRAGGGVRRGRGRAGGVGGQERRGESEGTPGGGQWPNSAVQRCTAGTHSESGGTNRTHYLGPSSGAGHENLTRAKPVPTRANQRARVLTHTLHPQGGHGGLAARAAGGGAAHL